MKINHLESENRTYFEQVHVAEADVDRMSKQSLYYKGKLERTKWKIADFIQKCY